jgi:hypothetical protein
MMPDIEEQVKEALWERFKKCSAKRVDGKGYVSMPEHNLIPGVSVSYFQDDVNQGSGNELKAKFRAIHSSSALAVNTFAPFKGRPHTLTLYGVHGYDSIQFEKKCPTGLGGTPPNLDVVAENEKVIVGVESKFLEYLTPKKPTFSASYKRDRLPFAESKWWELVEELRMREALHLDVAQLIKHYLGLMNQKEYRGRDIILLYLFWEPENWTEFDLFKKHREEIAWFKERVHDTSVKFTSQSYPELWKEWESKEGLAEHLFHLKQRYSVTI